MKPSNLKKVMIRAVILISMVIAGSLQILPWSEPIAAQAAGLDEIWMDWVQYESGDNYAQAGGDGGLSYGRYQFNLEYSLPEFMQFCLERSPDEYAVFLRYVGGEADDPQIVTTSGLDVAWQQLYDEQSASFAALQDEFLLTGYYYPVQDGLSRLYDIDLNQYSAVLKGTVLSVALRDGSVVSTKQRCNCLATVTDTYYAGIPEMEWVEAIYDAESKKHPDQAKRWGVVQKEAALAKLNELLCTE